MDAQSCAKTLRQNMTDAEQALWKYLRAHRLNGEKFRRQQLIGRYIVDFAHFSAKVIIEVDGSQHFDSTKDAERDTWFAQQGFKVLRFWNNDVLQNTEAVLSVILDAVTPSP